MSEPQTPDWVRDAVFYQIFPDRFARSDRGPEGVGGLQPWGSPPTVHGYQGGDLLGVVERLDYLADLGVNALYFTPVFQSASNHRYHTHDYEKVDPMLGGNAALRRAARRGPRPRHPGRARRRLQPRQPRLLPVQRHPRERQGFRLSRLVPRRGLPADGLPPRRTRRTTARGGACPPCRSSGPRPRPSASSSGGSPATGSTSASTAGGSTCRTRSTTTPSGASSAAGSRRATPTPTSSARSGATAPAGCKGDMFDAVMNYIFTKACIAFFIGDAVDRRRAASPSRSATPRAGRRPTLRRAPSSRCGASTTRTSTPCS